MSEIEMNNRVASEVSAPGARDLHASFGGQTRALFRKQWAFQKRNVGQNICLIFTPVFFCLIMLIIQVIIDGLLADFKCGCKCAVCCNDRELTDCFEVGEGRFCDANTQFCKERDEDLCGIEYSDVEDAGFCAIPSPAEWPPLLFVPEAQFRPVAVRPDVSLLYTGQDMGAAAQYTAQMIPHWAADASDPSRPDAATLLTSVAPRVEAVLQSGISSNYALAKALASAIVEDPSVAPVLGTYQRTSGLPTMHQDEAWTGLAYESALVAVSSSCDDLVSGAKALADEMDDTAWDRWNEPQLNDDDEVILSDTVWAKLLEAKTMTCAEVIPRSMESVEDVNEELFCGYFFATGCGRDKPESNMYPAAIDWKDTSSSRVAVRLWLNDTDPEGQDGPSSPERVLKLFNMAVNSWLHTNVGSEYDATQTFFKEMPKPETRLSLDFSSLLGPLFFVWVLGLPLPVMMQSLVYEKENRLRVMMRMHGLSSNTYWLVSYLWWITVTFFYSLFLMIFGAVIGLNFFAGNDFLLQIVFYITLQHAQVGLGFLFSALFSSAKTATVVGYLWVLGSGIVAGNVMDEFIADERSYVPVLELLPPFGVYRGLFEMSQYAFRGQYRGEGGLTWADLSDDNNGMGRVMGIFVLEFVVFMALAWYLEQVVDDTTGVRRSWGFLWEGWRDKKAQEEGFEKDRVTPVSDEELSGGADVMEERERALGMSAIDSEEHPIIIKNLHKVYPATDGNPPKTAVKSLSLAVKRGEVLGLIGPNGAGKTTSINMLVGFMEPSAGTAIINGFDILHDMDVIYTQMGVCPQHDILWHRLTGREHLNFYGRLKNIPKARLKEEVDSALKAVNLLTWGDKPCGSYSGGMKRRLSVAISIIGAPKVVYMDEPSTGLDPASRRNLWDVVKHAKQNKAVVLTTHSMQEAEALCDRLGIFVDGELFTIGNPREIASRYGGYVIFSISVPEEEVDGAVKLAKSLHSSAEITYQVKGTLKIKIGAELNLSAVFKAVEDAKAKGLHVIDWAVQHASLEDVFIEIAKRAGARGELGGGSFKA